MENTQKRSRIEVNQNTKEKIEKIAKELGFTQVQVMDYLYGIYEKKFNSVSDKKLKNSNSKAKGTAFARVDMFVKSIMKHNETDTKDKIHLGVSLVRRETGSGAKTVSNYLTERKKMIEDHNKKLGINGKSNTKYRLYNKSNGKLDFISEILKKDNIYDIIRHENPKDKKEEKQD